MKPAPAKQRLTPKLRFPEFRKAEGWKTIKVDELVDTLTPPKKLPTSLYSAKGKFPIVDQSQDAICGWTDDPNAVIREGLPLVVFGDHTCILKFVEQPFVQGADGIKILSARASVDARFLYQFLCHAPVVTEEYKRHYSILKEKLVHFPDIKTGEQRKIASCLVSIDELIAAESRKLAALKAYKKGLMQHLFPREGETKPRLRFPEFENAGEWDAQSFASLYEFKPTNTFSRDLLNYESGSAKNIHYGDIHTKLSTLFRIEAETVPFVNSSESLSKLKPDAYCQEGDMVFADASEDLADVGKSIELADLNGEKVLSGSHTILARQKGKVFIVGFAGYLFKGRGVRAQIEKEAQGTKVLQISPGRLAGIKVMFPRNTAEQQRIASCLSSLDDLIAAQTQKLEALKTHKKGLMQQLFPVPENTL